MRNFVAGDLERLSIMNLQIVFSFAENRRLSRNGKQQAVVKGLQKGSITIKRWPSGVIVYENDGSLGK